MFYLVLGGIVIRHALKFFLNEDFFKGTITKFAVWVGQANGLVGGKHEVFVECAHADQKQGNCSCSKKTLRDIEYYTVLGDSHLGGKVSEIAFMTTK